MRVYKKGLIPLLGTILVAATMIGSQVAGTTSWVSWVLADWQDANTIPSYSGDRKAYRHVMSSNGGKRHSFDQQSGFPNNNSVPPNSSHGEEVRPDKESNDSGGDDSGVDTGGGQGGGSNPLSGNGFATALGALAGLLAAKNNQQGNGAASLDQLQQRSQELQKQIDAMEQDREPEQMAAAPTATATPTRTPTSTPTEVGTIAVAAEATATTPAAITPSPTFTIETSGGM
jgi:hypothetical protein